MLVNTFTLVLTQGRVHMRKTYHLFLAVILSFSSYAAAYGEEIRDYYAEPGLNPFKETLNQDLNEHIDPFSGTLQHKYVDMYIPGNGGLDLKVSRVYTSPQEALGVRTVTGAGWTMHFGRVVIPTDYTDTLCLQDLYAVSTKDNPSIEFPDGGRELLVLDAVHGTYLITKSGWRAMCNGSGQGLIVTSPTGTVYTMDALNTLNNHWSWYTTNIRDRHGNTIDVTYKTNSSNFIYIDTVTASDGRQVKFEYLDEESATIRLDKITANEQTWIYRYERIEAIGPGYGDNYHNLTEVIRPDGLRWRYSYYPYTSLDAAGNYALKTVTYPYGANITYTYQHIDFTPTDLSIDRTTAIATKEVSGDPPGISVGPGSSLPSGTWRFEFEPHSPELFRTDKGTWASGLDKTTVRMPGGKQVFYHYGYSYTGGLSSGLLWLTGMLYKQETRDGCSADSCAGVGSTLVDEVTNGWEPRLISHENFWHGREGLDEDTYVPQLARKVHSRDDSGNEIRYEHYDAFGNAGRISESSNLTGDPDKVTEISYYIDREKWILHQVEDETILGANGEVVSHTDRSFNEDADLIAADQNGVLTSYTYTAEGDLATATDARGSTTRYASYHRGSAQIETHPESVTLARVVNDTGTAASQTNGRGFTRHFTYDAMNRLTGITYPRHAPVSVAWDASGKTLTRGSYEERITLDGFGRVVSTARADTALGIRITQTMKYDVHSNKLFESYPNSEAGVSYAYDLLKRLTTLQHPDGTLRSYVYGGGGVTETDERGNTTNYLYRSFGDPDKDKVLVMTTEPNAIYTILDYNLLNLPTSVFQGDLTPTGSLSGFTRRLSYDSRYFLISVSDPETGVTSYGRDEVGNMISRQVGSSGVTAYTYDTLNRQVFIDYPGATPDVGKSYDADGHLTKLTNSQAVIDHRYDENDNLIEKVLTLDGVPYVLNFTYNALDGLATLTYPSGRVVDYLPDAFGRPTQAAPYVSAVSYHPSGQLAGINHANGGRTEITLNDRQWISEFLHHGLAELHYAYDALGNVLGLTDPLNPAEDRAFGYDALNRLTSAQGRWGQGTLSYDAFGNLRSLNLGANTERYAYNGLRLRTRIHNETTSSWYTHDVYGNVRLNVEVLGLSSNAPQDRGQQYTYDDAGNLRNVLRTENIASNPRSSQYYFDYDALGQQIRRTAPNGEIIHFVHGRTGQLLGEYTGSPQYGKEYVYLGSQFLASARTNQPPEAQAGADETVLGGATVFLDGRASMDPDGRIVRYAWAQTEGRPVTLSGAAAATASFSAPVLENTSVLGFTLTVTDDSGEEARDSVRITVLGNAAPTADAGPDQSVRGAALVALDGTASNDTDGHIARYAWQQIGGTPVTLSGADTAIPSFTAPRLAEAQVLSFALTVSDNLGAQATAAVHITVFGNEPPSAHAGADQTVPGGSRVGLDATGSTDPEGSIIVYAWSQTGGPAVSLNGGDTPIPHFMAPLSGNDEVLSFTLTVSDDLGASGSDSVTITVQRVALGNQPPSAEAGVDQELRAGGVVELNGGASTDPEGQPLRYQWTQIQGPRVRLAGASTSRARFTAPYVAIDTRLRFELTVTDSAGLSAEDRVDIVVQPNAQGTDTQASLTRLLTTPLRFGRTVYYPVLLSANEPATTYLRVSDPNVVSLGALKTTEWQVYRGPLLVTLTSGESLTVEYYSIDRAGNQGSIKTRVLQ